MRFFKIALGMSLIVLCDPDLRSSDCNGNGIDDADDLSSGASTDCNSNGIPDECDLKSAFKFPSAVEFPAGEPPVWVMVADLDGDHHLDVVSANSNDQTSEQYN